MTNYTFPNISYESSVVGATPVNPPWKDRYAIIGEFNRGPVEPIASNRREVFASLFGEDTSSGSTALQQAMQQGATNAVVSRVLPSSEAGSLVFELAGDNLNITPNTAYESTFGNTLVLDDYNRTTGFALTLDYIGSPIFNRSSYGRVATKESYVTHPTFNGRAQLNFVVTKTQPGLKSERVVYEDTNEVLSLTVHNSTKDDYQVVTYTEGSNAAVEQYLKQGFSLRVNDSAQPEGLVIAAEPYDFDNNGTKAVLVKGHFSLANSYGATIVAASGINDVVVTGFRKGDAAFVAASGTRLSILGDSVALFGGAAYPVSEVNTAAGDFVVTFASNVSASVNTDAPMSFVPKVLGVAYANDVTTVELEGVLENYITTGVKISFGGRSKAYTVASISTAFNATAGTVKVAFAGDIRADVKARDYALVTSATTTEITKDFRVHFPAKTQYIVGYRLNAIDGGALTPYTLGKAYYAVGGGLKYNDGLNVYDIDSYVVFEEGTGNQYIPFKYQAVSTSPAGAELLTQETFGLELKFGFADDTKLYLTKNMSWSVPFLKTSVTVGGKAGSGDEYAENTCADIILKDLEYAVYANSAFSSVVKDILLETSAHPFRFTLIPSIVGLESNRFRWNLIRYVDGPTAVFSYASSNDLIVDAVPDIINDDTYSDYVLVLNGEEYPVIGVNAGEITVDLGSNVTALDALSANDVLHFQSQAQTRDILVRQDLTASFDVTDYGADKYFAFTGGRDSATFAYRDFYNLNGAAILRVRALNPGSYGNNLRVTVLPDQTTADSARFYLQVEDLNSGVTLGGPKTESFYLDNKAIDKATGLYTDTRDSNLIRAYFIPALEPSNIPNLYNLIDQSLFRSLPVRTAPPLELQDALYAVGATRTTAQGARAVKSVKLEGGQEYKDPSLLGAIRARKDGYLNALRQIESKGVSLIVIAGIYYGDNDYKEVFDELKAIVERSAPMTGGFCRGVVELVPNISPRQAAVLRTQMNSDRIVQIAGQIRGTLNNGDLYSNVGAAGVYAGLAMSRPPHISPASVFGGRTPLGVNYSSIDSTPATLEAYTQAGTEVIYYDSGLGVYKFLNGLTTSTDTNKRYFSVLQTWDQVRNDIYLNLLSYLSEPANVALRSRIASAVDAYLADKLRQGWLLRYAPTICDSSNNSDADLLKGKVNILLRATPSFPADYIKVNDILDLSETLTVAASAQ